MSTGKWLGYENGELYNDYPGDFKTPQQNSEKPGAKGFIYEPFFIRFLNNLKYWNRWIQLLMEFLQCYCAIFNIAFL